jgi:hypothetical protein
LDKSESLPQIEKPAPLVDRRQIRERTRLFKPDRMRSQIRCRYGEGFIPWKRILIRSGFVFEETDGSFDLSAESEPNRRYFGRLLVEIGLDRHFDGIVFTPPSPEYDENSWLSAWESIHEGSEGPGKKQMGFEGIDLKQMDTAMAGVVRWLNRMGHVTNCSCDGHGRPGFLIQPQKGDVFNVLQEHSRLSIMRESRFRSRFRFISLNGRLVMDPRKQLLNLAENLYWGKKLETGQRPE